MSLESHSAAGLPKISVGMPVYNGAEFILQALDALLSQSYTNFELIISDNASTDTTQSICLDYAARDPRIKYVRNEVNIGSVGNFQRVLALSTGEYFMWAAHDDLWCPHYIQLCLDAFLDNPKAALCFTSTVLLQREGSIFGDYKDEDLDTVGLEKLARLKKVIKGVKRNCAFYGLYRRDILERVSFPNRYGGDHIFLAELSLYGEFIQLPEPCFYSRLDGAGSSRAGILKSQQIRSLFVRCFPNFSFFLDFLHAVTGWQTLDGGERWQAASFVLQRFLSWTYISRMLLDIVLLGRDVIFEGRRWMQERLSPAFQRRNE